MRSSLVFTIGTLGVIGCAGMLLAQIAVKHFNPPRAAIVDTFEVIENYKKKEVLEGELRKKVEEAVSDVEELERELKSIESDMGLIEEGTDAYSQKILKRTELQLRLESLKKKIKRDLEEIQLKAIQEIRKEVEQEIEKYAASNALHLVIEKKIPIEGRGNVKINIPIVRFVSPELEITKEITKILNDRYQRVMRTPPQGR